MRISPVERKQASWMLQPLYWFLQRQFGKVLTPYKVWAHRPGIILAFTATMGALEYSKGADKIVKRLVTLRTAQIVGCPF
jgi:alkylhydroperoxidase family enzyme